MKVAVATVAYREARLLPKFLQHIPDWVDTKLLLLSTKPWYGDVVPDDGTADIASSGGAITIAYDWKTEADQRNAGQQYLSDYDWIIWLDPDEFLDDKGWDNLHKFLELSTANALIVERQRVFWKDHQEVEPHADYKQLIAVKPGVQFTEGRVVDSAYQEAPVTLFHFSWARTDDEVRNKISHYTHAPEFDTEKWFNEVWKANKTENLHPKDPEVLQSLIPAELPTELEQLELWP